jgi:hypothetical protein
MGRHRADIKSPKCVIELQSSSISVDEVYERESFYENMVWVLDAREFNLQLRDRDGYVSFRWKHPRKTWWEAERLLFFDLGNKLLRIGKIHQNCPCGGWGTFVSYSDFVEEFSRPRRGEELCDACKTPFPKGNLIETGMWEFYTMDLDPLTPICADCYEAERERHIPDDPSLVDCLTPVQIA